ncbi:MAG: chromosomal replication initiator protein DnaA, partial [Solirubrobacterales bacterium]|nr:chromosomal replication initiator protein DnaA [Solirubrobacterales bacterium]
QHDGIEIADEAALEAIARRITVNTRMLEGALIRVVAFHSLTGRPIDAELADEVLSGLYPEARRTPDPTIDRVQEITCEAFGITREELLSPSRSGRLTWPRHVAMYLSREHTSETLPAIGERFGGRSHTTVLHACKRTGQRIAGDPEAGAIVATLARRLSEPA